MIVRQQKFEEKKKKNNQSDHIYSHNRRMDEIDQWIIPWMIRRKSQLMNTIEHFPRIISSFFFYNESNKNQASFQ